MARRLFPTPPTLFLAGALLAAPVALEAAPARVAAVPAQGDGVAGIVARLRAEGDRAKPEWIHDLAAIGTRHALEGLLSVYDVFSTIFMQREVVRALPAFDGVPDAELPALQKLTDVVTASEEPELRSAALQALGRCPSKGRDFLRLIVESPATDGVRERALALHIHMASGEDRAWYKDLYERKLDKQAAAERELEKKKPKKQRKDDEQAQRPRHTVSINTIRLAAFRAICSGLTPEELHAAVLDAHHLIRIEALQDLEARGDKRARELARERFDDLAERAEVRVAAARIVVQHEGLRSAPDLLKRASNVDTPVELRRALAELLAGMGDAGVNRQLIGELSKGRAHEKLFAIHAVRAMQDERVDKALLKLLADKEAEVVRAAAAALGERGAREALPALEKLWHKSPDPSVGRAALDATARIRKDDPAWVAELVALATSADPGIRHLALSALGEIADLSQLGPLAAALDDPNWSVRLAALQALERLRDRAAVDAIVARMGQEEGRMLQEFARTLWRLTGQPFQDKAQGWAAWWKENRERFEFVSEADLEKARTGEEDWRLKQTTRVKSDFFGIRIASHKVLFIIDVSGSMEEPLANDYLGKAGWTRMAVVKSELVRSVESLDPVAFFNILTFSGGVERWLDGGLAAANEKHRGQARAWVEKLKAFGGTNLHDALKTAFEDPDVDTIFLMSDGEPSAGEVTEPLMIRERVRRWNEHRGVVIHTIAVGGQFSILEWLADDSGGTHVKFE